MARKRTKSPKATTGRGGGSAKRKPSSKEEVEQEPALARVTLEALEAMSDSDDDDGDNVQIPENQWSTKAKNLRSAIENGQFDKLLAGKRKNAKHDDDDDDDEPEFEEHTLGSSDDDDDDDPDDQSEQKMDQAEDEEEEESGPPQAADEDDDEDEEEEQDSEDDDDSEEEEEEEDQGKDRARQMLKNNQNNYKALAVVTAELVASHAGVPWGETFDVIPPTPLPFGEKAGPDSSPLDIHDDLKREVAFYNSTLEAVHEARTMCGQANIPFSRPEDFFAEMVKTDDHMAKVKDRLIFETKKMEAVAQRKSNTEQKLRAKESHSNKLAEKAKRKRDHFDQVEEWANSAAQNRGGALQDDADDKFLRGGPSKGRKAADRKFGFGGKTGRFKQNGKASMNDMSGYNPRGNFPGMGTKKTAKGRGGSGADRPGKRARDANRARK